jgi:hypothetical protein
MEMFIHEQNLLLLRKQLTEMQHETRRIQILKLLTEEEAKNCAPPKEKYAMSVDRLQREGESYEQKI